MMLQGNKDQLRQIVEKARDKMKNADSDKTEALISEAVAAVRAS